jgi:large subunit ribosomal protein L6
MSRIGKKPVPIPAGVQVSVAGGTVTVKGPKGSLTREVTRPITVAVEKGQVVCTRQSEDREVRAKHGLVRSLIENMVLGVSQGYERVLEINGVGYKADPQGKNKLVFTLGHTHPIEHELPAGVTAEVEKNVRITLRGPDNQVLGQQAAQIRSYRPPEPYKGKGVKYAEERIRRKVGKAGTA